MLSQQLLFYANRITRWICISYRSAYELISLLTSNYIWTLQSADLKAAYYAFIKIFSSISMNRVHAHENTNARSRSLSLTCRAWLCNAWLNEWACFLTGGVINIMRGCNTWSNLCSWEINHCKINKSRRKELVMFRLHYVCTHFLTGCGFACFVCIYSLIDSVCGYSVDYFRN